MKSSICRVLALAVGLSWLSAAHAWEPTRNIEFIIPAGTGGGADQMARAIQAIVAKHNLAKVAILPINKSGGAGAEAHFVEVFRDAGVDGALAASVFHSGEIPIPRLKAVLAGNGIAVRP